MAAQADYVQVLEKVENFYEENRNHVYNKEKQLEILKLLRSVKKDMGDELQRARIGYQKNFVLSTNDLKLWHDDLLELEDGPDKVEFLRQFYEVNMDDNKTSWFYSMYVQFATDALLKDEKDSEGRAVYSLESVNLILEQAIQNTTYDFQNSHQVWNQVYEFRNQLGDIDYNSSKEYFLQRLKVPHKLLDETFSAFSSLVTSHANDRYDQEMTQANKIYSQTQKDQWDLESWELRKPTYDEPQMFWADYLNFLFLKPKKQRKIEHISAVFERAIHESQDQAFISVWLKYIHILYDFQASDGMINSIIQRFIRSYQSSAAPYAEFFHNLPTQSDIEVINSQYTNISERIGTLKLLEELPYDEWNVLVSSWLVCQLKMMKKGYEDFTEALLLDMEIYFSQAVENCRDVYHSVERLCVSIQESLGEIEAARVYLKKITAKFSNEAENWLIYHNFEKRHGDYASASKILYAAITRAEALDWPERIFEEALTFERVYGTVSSYRQLQAKIDKKSIQINNLRKQQLKEQSMIGEGSIVEETEKRKAEEELHDDEAKEHKRRKTENQRDREHLTVTVKNIPKDTKEEQIFKFFIDCGQVRDHHLVVKDDRIQAKLEFTDEQAVLKALTKDHKRFHGSELRVSKAYQTTVWVTNFPPSYTNESVRSLFSAIGEVASVRFPSLKFNSQRRFCYVEFLESKDAKESVHQLNNKEVEGYKLVVKISDPESKAARTGAVEEGREVYVSRLDFNKVTIEKVKQLFEKYGTVERINLPSKSKEQGRKHDGYGFVTFSTADEAQASLELNLISFEGRAIEVSISKKKSERTLSRENAALKDYRSSGNVIALLKVPDTINSTQIKEICSEAGPVENVVLEPEHEGALVEFKDVNDAGKAALKLEGKRLSNYTLKIGTVQDLKRTTINTNQSKASRPLIPSSLRRRQAFQKTAVAKADKSANNSKDKEVHISAQSDDNMNINKEQTTGRSNDDFRAMLLGKK